MSIYNDDRTPVKIIWVILSTYSIEKKTSLNCYVTDNNEEYSLHPDKLTEFNQQLI